MVCTPIKFTYSGTFHISCSKPEVCVYRKCLKISLGFALMPDSNKYVLSNY